MSEFTDLLPHVNASLNVLAALLLVVGYVLIRKRHEAWHKRAMMTAFIVSTLFLVSYLAYHQLAGHKRFPSYPSMAVRGFYYVVLVSHVLLAFTVPFLAIATIVQGLRDRRTSHRKLAKWTFPIWLYVSITGVIVYLMLYQLYPPNEVEPIIQVSFASSID